MLRNQLTWFSIVMITIGAISTPSLAQERPMLRQQLREQRSPYANPALNVGPWTMMGGNRNAYLFSLASQQRAAQKLLHEELIAGRAGMAEKPGSAPQPSLHQQQPGGVSASQFFGRTTIFSPQQTPAPLARYDRYKHFFGGRRN